MTETTPHALAAPRTPLSGEARARSLRAARMRHAAVTSVPVMAIIACMYPMGIIDGAALAAIEAFAFVQIASYLLSAASGSAGLAHDPQLTAARTIGAVSVLLLAALASTTHGRTVPLLLVPVAFSFALYQYGRLALLRLAAVLTAMVAAEQAATVLWRPHLLDWNLALMQTAALAIALLSFALIGGQANDYRRRTQFERAMAGMALSQMHEAVVAVDLAHRIRSINAGAARLFGVEPDALAGRPIGELFELDGPHGPGGPASLFEPQPHEPGNAQGGRAGNAPGSGAGHAHDGAQGGEASDAQGGQASDARGGQAGDAARAATIRLSGGARREVELSTAVLRRLDGVAVGHVLVARDVQRTNQLIRELTHNSTHDALTGLRNRRGFLSDLEALVRLRAPHAAHAAPGVDCLLVLDLDRFKIVNDACGHAAGDDLLKMVARAIASHFPAARSVARLGGDEFGLIVRACSASQCEAQAAGLLQRLAASRFVRDGRPFQVGASVGIALIEPGRPGDETALAQADAACYLAKELGRGRVQTYRLGDEQIARHQRDLGWAARLQEAIERDRFVLYAQRLQPTAQPRPAAAEHYELLLRLRADDGTLVPPDAFLPAAERFGLMPAVDRWVIAHAIAQAGALGGEGAVRPHLAINLSASSLRDAGLVDFVAGCLRRHGVDGRLFTFELTESAALLDLHQARAFIEGLKRLGCRVALDDVGAGFSSFSHLRLLPIDQIKIDGSFVRSVCDNPLDRVLVESLQRVAEVLGVQTVAEYVENACIEQALRSIGVTYLQGWAVHRPEPLAGLAWSAAGVPQPGSALGGRRGATRACAHS